MASQFPGDSPQPYTPPPPPYAPGPGGSALVDRVKNIIVTPATEWPRIAAEPATVKGLFTNYAAPLAAIGPVAGLIRNTLFFHQPIVLGLFTALLGFAFLLGMAFLLILIVNALAPSFGGTKDMVQATKLIVYSYTPAWLAGIFLIIVPINIIAYLVSIYGFFLLWLGLPILMRSPQDKSTGFFIVTVLAAIGIQILAFVINFFVIAAITLTIIAAATPGIDLYR